MTDKNSIQHLFESFSGKHILVIGDSMIDAYLWGRVDRISPEAPVPVVAVQKRENRLGGAANVALNIRNLGGIPLLCSVIGHDEKGQLFTSLMKEQALSSDGMIESKLRKTTVKFRIIGNNAQMLRVDEESPHSLNEEETQSLYVRICSLVDQHPIETIVFEDYDKGVITPTLISMTLALAREKGIPVAVDPKKNNFMQYKGVTLFKPNMKELKEGLKLDSDPDNDTELKAAVHTLMKKLDIQTLMVTLSERGIFYSQVSPEGTFREGRIPAYFRSIADVSGAGDTVIGTAALCLASKTSPELMAAVCNLAGGLVCEHVGVVPVDKDKLLQETIAHFSR